MKYSIDKWRKVFVWKWVYAYEAGYEPESSLEEYNGDTYKVRFEYVETKTSKWSGGQVYRVIKN